MSVVLVTVTGCGNSHVPGSGTVTYSSGEPVPGGIIFFSTSQFNYTATIENGLFELGGLKEKDGLPPGKYHVHLIGSKPSEGTDQDVPLFAAKYNDPTTSGIVIEIKSEKNQQIEIIVEKP
ncbi:MAG: carboxypeptidase-like regulatory domain-containing protein [Planctomycetaceae bacterium]|nr:carboxypeptidase-like regulatory domain-containing protein [Planctomycetaceae bacterium]